MKIGFSALLAVVIVILSGCGGDTFKKDEFSVKDLCIVKIDNNSE